MKKSTYKPRRENREMLEAAFEYVRSLPYKTSLRSCFYHVLSLNLVTKDQYNVFKNATIQARKRKYFRWKPDTFEDETRNVIYRGHGYPTTLDWVRSFGRTKCNLDKFAHQEFYVMLWFESKAMIGQFDHYTRGYHLSLVPFGGDPSISLKHEIAKHLEAVYLNYKLPIVVLYFGDYDPKGRQIPESAVKDIREWCSESFEFIRVGLNIDQVNQFNLIENFDKPGTYQWEALPDKQAGDLIISAVHGYIDMEKIKRVEDLEQTSSDIVKLELPEFISRVERLLVQEENYD